VRAGATACRAVAVQPVAFVHFHLAEPRPKLNEPDHDANHPERDRDQSVRDADRDADRDCHGYLHLGPDRHVGPDRLGDDTDDTRIDDEGSSQHHADAEPIRVIHSKPGHR